MKKTRQRLLASLLTGAMLLSMCSGALAAEPETKEEKAVSSVQTLKQNEGYVDRADAAEKIYEYFNWSHRDEYNDIWAPDMVHFDDVAEGSDGWMAIECLLQQGDGRAVIIAVAVFAHLAGFYQADLVIIAQRAHTDAQKTGRLSDGKPHLYHLRSVRYTMTPRQSQDFFYRPRPFRIIKPRTVPHRPPMMCVRWEMPSCRKMASYNSCPR